MERQFPTAKYIFEGKEEIIEYGQINQENYQSKYKDKLHCPGTNCNAKLKYVIRKNGATTLLQAVDVTTHVDGCPYHLDYKKYNNTEKENPIISDEHIIDTIKYQLNKLLKPHEGKKITKGNSTKTQTKREIKTSIQGYPIENIDRSLRGRLICAVGSINSIKINEPRGYIHKHAYINYNKCGSELVSVLFSENLFIRNENTQATISSMKTEFEYIKHQKRKDVVCVCVGWVNCVQKGINIVPLNLDSLKIAELD